MRGQFRFILPNGTEELIKNTIVDEGEEQYLKMLFQDAAIGGGGNYYIGLCDQVPAETDTIASITSELTVVNGYARSALARNAVDWPTVDAVNGVKRITSKLVTFTAAGGDFDKPFTRAFLCNVATGAVGTLFAYSGPLTTQITLLNGQSFQMQYEFFLD